MYIYVCMYVLSHIWFSRLEENKIEETQSDKLFYRRWDIRDGLFNKNSNSSSRRILFSIICIILFITLKIRGKEGDISNKKINITSIFFFTL